MSEIAPIIHECSTLTTVRPTSSRRLERTIERPQMAQASLDQVEFSELGQSLSRLDPSTEIRADKVAVVRQAIADGTYMTEEKLAIAVDRLVQAIQSSR